MKEMNERYLLGIDLGTTGLKAALFDEEGGAVGLAYRKSPYLPLPEGRREQSAVDWWGNLCSAVREVLGQAKIEPRRISGVGICGFHHCPVFLGEDGEPARPVLLLHDSRLAGAREAMKGEGLLQEVESRTRSMVSSAHFPPIVYHLQKREPSLWRRVRWIVLPKDYLRYRLTGKIRTEICDATGTNLIEPEGTDWSDDLCDLLAVDRNLLPPIGDPGAAAGGITDDAARETGLAAGTPVAYGGGDSHCALLGLGCIRHGDTGMLLGTNSTLRTVFARFVSHPEFRVWVQHHVVPGHYTVSASSMAGASVLTWAVRNLTAMSRCSDEGEAYRRVVALARLSPPGSRGIVFLPYLHGERSPFYDPEACGSFWGIRAHHDSGDILRSVFEGVALNIVSCYRLTAECSDPGTLGPIRLGGGGSGIALWHRIIADCLGRPIHVMEVREAGCLGAAILAGIATGIYGDLTEAVSRTVRTERVVEPDGKLTSLYEEKRRKMNDLLRRVG